MPPARRSHLLCAIPRLVATPIASAATLRRAQDQRLIQAFARERNLGPLLRTVLSDGDGFWKRLSDDGFTPALDMR